MSVAISIAIFGALIAIHEAGHYLVARWAGMRVDRFSIGFGPGLSFRRGPTEWRVGFIPFGGYVKIAGLNPHDGTPVNDPGSFANKPAWKRLLVIVAGPGVNYVLAWVMLFVLALVGITSADPSTRVGVVRSGYPAAAAGLRPGDRITALDGEPVEKFLELATKVRERKSQALQLTVEREGQLITIPVTTTEDGLIGVSPAELIRSYGPLDAAIRATETSIAATIGAVFSIGAVVSGRAEGDLMGPVGIASEVATQVERGPRWLAGIIAFLSLMLGFFNLLPIPGLDGGRAAFLAVELVRRRPVDQRIETWVHAMGFLLLLGLILAVTVGDVGRLVKGRDEPAAEAVDGGVAPDGGAE